MLIAGIGKSSLRWASLSASFTKTNFNNSTYFFIFSRVGCPGIGLASLKLGLQPSFIRIANDDFVQDLHVLTSDLSLQRWTSHFEAGSKKLILFVISDARAFGCHFEAGPPARLYS